MFATIIGIPVLGTVIEAKEIVGAVLIVIGLFVVAYQRYLDTRKKLAERKEQTENSMMADLAEMSEISNRVPGESADLDESVALDEILPEENKEKSLDPV